MGKKASRITEREVAAQLSAALTDYIRSGKLPFEKATVEHHAGSGYPDITVWTDYARSEAFAFWELKRPGLHEDLSKLPQKAHALGVRYVVVWNFQDGELYEVAGNRLESRKSYPTPILNSLEEWAIPTKRIAVISQARRILDDLARLFKGESLTPFVPDKFYFIGILQQAIYRLRPVLEKRLFDAKKEKDVRKRIDAWAVKQGYPLSLPDLDALLARHWAYSLAVRILFYFTVRRYYPSLPDLRVEGVRPVADALWDAFSRAQSVDWHAVFEPSPLDELGLPESADPILRELLGNFHRYDFTQLKEDVIGEIMEGLIPEQERHALGQYFTREDLVDLIIGFVANREEAYYLDPTCGSGTFLTRLYSRLRWLSAYRATHSDLLERIWGVDIAHFPAELATINLFRQDVKDLSNFPRIVVRDFFKTHPHQVFSFPPLKATPSNYSKIRISMPTFHGIVGNFPYIRQELIERRQRGYKREIVRTIAHEWFWKDPELFKMKDLRPEVVERASELSPEKRERWLDEQIDEGRVDLKLSGQADIYAYMFYHAASFLEDKGRMGIVTSNAWLDAAYGEELKRFFLRHFKIIAIVASWCEPWFEDAAISTAFVILERCEDEQERDNNLVRFVKIKKPLSELLPQDLILKEAERWQKVDALVRQIEAAEAQVISWDPSTDKLNIPRGVKTLETEDFRIRLISQRELKEDLMRKGETAKWGLYIRAPQVYFEILEKAGDKLVPLGQIADVRFGIKTGINDFFYLEPLNEKADTPGCIRVKNARGWVGEIEEECLRPVIKSPKEAKGLVIDPKALRYRLFLPPLGDVSDPEEALRVRYPKAYEYVKWGEKQRTKGGTLWPKVPSVVGRKAWWLLPEKEPGAILMPMINRRRFAAFDNESKVFVDNRLFEFLVDYTQAELYAALMNSTLFALIREISSRVNLEGVTDTKGIDWKYSVLIPDPRFFSEEDKKVIVSAYRKIRNRPVYPISQEIKRKDRQALDKAVLEALGLDPDYYLPKIYKGLVELVEERLALPKMRTAKKKREKRLSIERIKQHVQSEVLPAGLKPIEAFLPPGDVEMMSVALTGRPVAWRAFFKEFALLDENGVEVGRLQGDEKQARYAVYAAKPGLYMLKVPSDPAVAGKAVQDYERYLRQTEEQLLLRALDATRDYAQAERIAKEILKSLGVHQ